MTASLETIPPEIGEKIAILLHPVCIPYFRLLSKRMRLNWDFSTSFAYAMEHMTAFQNRQQAKGIEVSLKENVRPIFLAALLKINSFWETLKAPVEDYCDTTTCVYSGKATGRCSLHSLWMRKAIKILLEHQDEDFKLTKNVVGFLMEQNIAHLVPGAKELAATECPWYSSHLETFSRMNYHEVLPILWSMERELTTLYNVERAICKAAEKGYLKVLETIMALLDGDIKIDGISDEHVFDIMYTTNLDIIEFTLQHPRLTAYPFTFLPKAHQEKSIRAFIAVATGMNMDPESVARQIHAQFSKNKIMAHPNVPESWKLAFLKVAAESKTAYLNKGDMEVIKKFFDISSCELTEEEKDILNFSLLISHPDSDPSVDGNQALLKVLENCDTAAITHLLTDSRVDPLVIADRQKLLDTAKKDFSTLFAILNHPRFNKRSDFIPFAKKVSPDGKILAAMSLKPDEGSSSELIVERLVWALDCIFAEDSSINDFKNVFEFSMCSEFTMAPAGPPDANPWDGVSADLLCHIEERQSSKMSDVCSANIMQSCLSAFFKTALRRRCNGAIRKVLNEGIYNSRITEGDLYDAVTGAELDIVMVLFEYQFWAYPVVQEAYVKALQRNDDGIIKYISERGAEEIKVCATTQDQYLRASIFAAALEHNHQDVIRLFLDGEKLGWVNTSHIFLAIQKADLDIVQKLVPMGAYDHTSFELMREASKSRQDASVIDYIQEFTSDPANAPLLRAVELEDMSLIEKILDKSVVEEWLGHAALKESYKRGLEKIVHIFEQKGIRLPPQEMLSDNPQSAPFITFNSTPSISFTESPSFSFSSSSVVQKAKVKSPRASSQPFKKSPAKPFTPAMTFGDAPAFSFSSTSPPAPTLDDPPSTLAS